MKIQAIQKIEIPRSVALAGFEQSSRRRKTTWGPYHGQVASKMSASLLSSIDDIAGKIQTQTCSEMPKTWAMRAATSFSLVIGAPVSWS